MIVKLTQAIPECPDLTVGQIYCVIGIEADLLFHRPDAAVQMFRDRH